jgi:hypothetical protein
MSSFRKTRLYPALFTLAALPLYATHSVAQEPDGDELKASSSSQHKPSWLRPRTLSGKYGWVTQQVCVRTVPNPPGIDQIAPDPPNQLNVPAEIVSMSGVGTASFKRDGTMHIDAGSWANELRHSQTAPGNTPMSGGFTPVCDGTYSIAANNRAKIDWNCTIDVTSTPGLAISAGPVNWDGFVSQDGNIIDLQLLGTRQTLTFKQNGNPVGEVQRLCMQKFTFHKLP